jgi:hypothetical protein
VTAARVQAVPAPDLTADAANDNAAADARADAALRRFLLAVGVYVIAAVIGWASLGVLVAHWIFE